MPLRKITDTIAAVTQCDKESITPESRLDSLGIDSLKAINIVYELEEEFAIEVPNDAIAGLVTVNDINLAISNLLDERRA
jgi:acyl carrier protein